LEAELDQCAKFKQEFPDLIAGKFHGFIRIGGSSSNNSHLPGFDLVGHEDGEQSKPLIEYAEPLLRFAEQHPDIPFLFHAGETLGDGTAADMNLYDAILLGTKRIGHGLVMWYVRRKLADLMHFPSFSLTKHPKLMEICREQKIAIEVCPIS